MILEILNSNAKTIRINKEDKPIEVVKSRLLKLNYSHIQYVQSEISNQTEIIKNKSAYLINSLYNSYTKMDIHFTNLVRHNMYENDKE
ncbi:hypothetical protein CG709_21540 [Lachnotalea glycerini]|nr:hypothetical protein CG709_21540 [Lachnotalea glycerini]